MTRASLALLALCCGQALAQSPVTMMPEGSKDMEVGAVLASVPRDDGRHARTLVLVPLLAVQWSNGVFLNGASVGMHWSRTPHLQYGPLLSLGGGGQHAPGESRRRKLVTGGFVSYEPLRNLELGARAHYGGGQEGHGTQLMLRATGATALGSHQRVSLTAGLNLANHDEMQKHFGHAGYRAPGGIKHAYLRGGGNWQLSNKITSITMLTASRLGKGPAASPLVQTRYGIEIGTGLSYRF